MTYLYSELFLVEFSWYNFGTILKNNIHQIIIIKDIIEKIIIFLKRIQLKKRTTIPKPIIDQGWHQKGFKSQKIFFEFESIKEIN